MTSALLSLALLPFVQSPTNVPAANPDPTLPPSDAPLVATVEGRGFQIYECQAWNSGGGQWVFRRPEATLYRPGTQTRVGVHSAGPTWTWADGSAITGKVVASTPSPDSSSVPSLLLQAYPQGVRQGELANVLWVRRSEAHGGAAPSQGCDSAHGGAMARMPYSATYSFYGAAPQISHP